MILAVTFGSSPSTSMKFSFLPVAWFLPALFIALATSVICSLVTVKVCISGAITSLVLTGMRSVDIGRFNIIISLLSWSGRFQDHFDCPFISRLVSVYKHTYCLSFWKASYFVGISLISLSRSLYLSFPPGMPSMTTLLQSPSISPTLYVGSYCSSFWTGLTWWPWLIPSAQVAFTRIHWSRLSSSL